MLILSIDDVRFPGKETSTRWELNIVDDAGLCMRSHKVNLADAEQITLVDAGGKIRSSPMRFRWLRCCARCILPALRREWLRTGSADSALKMAELADERTRAGKFF